MLTTKGDIIMSNMTKEARVLAGLNKANPKGLTAGQITSRFRVPNPSATIFSLRQKGYKIYSNRKATKEGVRTFYRLGA